jgi:hypothetical protein
LVTHEDTPPAPYCYTFWLYLGHKSGIVLPPPLGVGVRLLQNPGGRQAVLSWNSGYSASRMASDVTITFWRRPVTLTLHLPPDLAQRLAQEAKRQGLALDAYTIQLLHPFLPPKDRQLFPPHVKDVTWCATPCYWMRDHSVWRPIRDVRAQVSPARNGCRHWWGTGVVSSCRRLRTTKCVGSFCVPTKRAD